MNAKVGANLCFAVCTMIVFSTLAVILLAFTIVEPRLCWSSGVARELEDQLPYSSYDGARQGYHHQGQAVWMWFPAERRPLQEILHPLQAV